MAKVKKDLPTVSIVDRRLAHPFGFPSESITLKEGQWSIRWFSEAVRSGRIYQAQQMGWEFVIPEELRGTASDISALVVDGRIVRGENANREVLMKMGKADFDRIQQAKASKNLADLGSSKKTRDVASNAAAAKFGDQAGEAVNRSNMEVTDHRASYDLEGDNPPT